MRVLSIGTDRNVFDEGSVVRARQEAYAREFGHLDLVVFSRRGNSVRHGVSRSLSLTPTDSRSRFLYGFDAIRIARRLPRPDAVTVQDPFETGFAALLVARMLGVPLHAQVHTEIAAQAWWRRMFARIVLPCASRIRVVSERIRGELARAGITAQITILPVFTDLARFESIPRAKHPRFKIALLFIGRLEREKRPCLAIDALAAARAAGHDAGLTIIGEGSERAYLEEKTRRLGIERFVEFIPWRRDVAPFLSQADIALVPSRYEGYGLAIVEALAAGVPVLATDVGIAREAGAIVVAPGEFPRVLVEWIARGPRQGQLAPAFRSSLPDSFSRYVRAYCDDIRALAPPRL